MAVEKSLYSAPMGLDDEDLPEDEMEIEPGLEIEIENPDMVTLDDGSVEITIIPEETQGEESFDANLAEYIDEGTLASIASDLVELVEADISSRKEWAEAIAEGIDLIGIKYDERTEPWDGACGVYSTILHEATIRFQAESIMESFPAAGPVKTKIVGGNESDALVRKAAERVREDMNYELTERMVEYRPEHERMLYSLGLCGAAFKKVYFDPSVDRQVSIFVPADDILMPFSAANIYKSERVTHVMRKTENEMRKLQVSGFYRDVELGEPQSFPTDIEKKRAEVQGYTLNDDDRYTLFEIHADYDLPGYEDEDGIALPYVITVDRSTNTVLSIRRNWSPDDTSKQRRQHFVQYTLIPGFGAYGYGYIHVIGGYARATTSLTRQLVDAGTLANLPGGLKSRGLRIKGDDTPIAPGEFRDVDVPSGSIRDNVMPLPYKEPSQTLLALNNQLTEEGRRLGAISEVNVSDMSANAPVGTTLAILERTLKPMSAVQARVHYAMKQEFKLLKDIIAEYAPDEYSYTPDGAPRKARKKDYDIVEVIPVSDPNSSTMAQRVVQYQAAIQLAQQAPQIYDLPQLHRQMLEVLGIKNANKLVPIDEDSKPVDPISENMAFLSGKPTKAFIYQDHQAHITAHQSFMQDPMIAQTIGQNPLAQQMMSSVHAHIAEHLAFQYRRQVEEVMGVPMPAPNEEMPEDLEVELSRMVAQASKQLLQNHQQEAQQKQAEQMQQDPLVQIQMKEVSIKEAEVQRKTEKDKMDYAIRQQQLAEKRAKDIADGELKEQQHLLQAQHHGVMGRAQDAEILRQDREQAMKLMDTLHRMNQINSVGESGAAKKGATE